MTDLLPRPTGATTNGHVPAVRCPSCGHGVDEHSVPEVKPGLLEGGCLRDWPLTQGCVCRWTPNDIAYAHGLLSWDDGYKTATEAMIPR